MRYRWLDQFGFYSVRRRFYANLGICSLWNRCGWCFERGFPIVIVTVLIVFLGYQIISLQTTRRGNNLTLSRSVKNFLNRLHRPARPASSVKVLSTSRGSKRSSSTKLLWLVVRLAVDEIVFEKTEFNTSESFQNLDISVTYHHKNSLLSPSSLPPYPLPIHQATFSPRDRIHPTNALWRCSSYLSHSTFRPPVDADLLSLLHSQIAPWTPWCNIAVMKLTSTVKLWK